MIAWLLLVGCPAPPTGPHADTAPATICALVDDNCDTVDDDCDGVADDDAAYIWYRDYDRDGYGNPDDVVVGCPASDLSDRAGDCDDGDRGIHPNATEHCDNIDHDCDGEVMDGAAAYLWTFYADADGDGYGDPDTPQDACVAPAGYTTDKLDCDDTNADISPDGVEVCDPDHVDEDCDGVADDDDPDGAIGQTFMWADYDEDGYAPEGADSDWFCTVPGNGWASLGGDCDDLDRRINPGHAEHCDGVDEDCDGVVDDHAVDGYPLYVDDDDDGFGAADAGTVACADSPGFATHPGDCDDANNLRHPDAREPCETATDLNCDGLGGGEDHDGDGVVACKDCDDTDLSRWGGAEVCNGVDDDCDGWIDGEDAADAFAVWPDADGDGYGDDQRETWACAVEAGFVLVGGDCDDADAAIHPGADDTECADHVDRDCDGYIPGADADGDGAPACTDCDDSAPRVYPGAPDPCHDGIDQDCDSLDNVCGIGASRLFGDIDNTLLHLAVGDLDGDGVAEVVAGDPSYDGSTVDRGDVFGFVGGLSGIERPTTADWTWVGAGTGDKLASALAIGVGADGVPRLVIGAEGEDTNGYNAGAVYVLASPEVTDPVDAGLVLLGEESFAFAGRTLAMDGDLDGDGAPDLVIGAPGQDVSTGDEGCVARWSTAATGAVGLSAGSAWICGTTAWRAFGEVVHAGADLDGDGLGELLVAAPALDGGTVWRFSGTLTGPLTDADAEEHWDGPVTGGRLGLAIATGADLDGDGLGELLLAAPELSDTGTDQGCVWRLGAGVALADAPWSICGAAGDTLGTAIVATGLAVAVGSPGDDSSGTDAGRVLIFTGAYVGTSAPADADTIVPGTGGLPGHGSLLAIGDLGGDGVEGLISGMPGLVWPTRRWAWSSP